MANNLIAKSYPALLKKIRSEIDVARKKIEHTRALAYWNVGGHIHKHILKNEGRPGYGDRIFNRLSKDLSIDKSMLYQSVRFHQDFPKVDPGLQLPWTHYRLLLTVHDKLLRDRLATTARKEGLSKRELAAEIKRSLPLAPRSTTYDVRRTELTPKRGPLNIYQSITDLPVPKGQVLLDCGFNVWTTVKRSDLKNVGEGLKPSPTVVHSRDKMSYTYKAYVQKIIDGDTMWVIVDLGLGQFTPQKLRLRGIDCPELNTAAGKKAKKFVEKALTGNKQRATSNNNPVPIIICSSKSDKYDRYLADVYYGKEERYLNQELLDVGLATAYKE